MSLYSHLIFKHSPSLTGWTVSLYSQEDIPSILNIAVVFKMNCLCPKLVRTSYTSQVSHNGIGFIRQLFKLIANGLTFRKHLAKNFSRYVYCYPSNDKIFTIILWIFEEVSKNNIHCLDSPKRKIYILLSIFK